MSGTAVAQDADPTAENRGAIEEIIVTAQKREQGLQTVPLAVTAVGAAQLREARIHDVSDIAIRTPNFTFTQFSPGQPGTYIRGIGSNEDGAAGDNSVAIFLDGVYIARGSAQVFDFYDLERVEVLRGPQGTLWGKNVVGGAVNVVTASPSEQFEMGVEGTFGNLGRLGTKAFVSGPLLDNVYGRLSLSYRDRDGHTENLLTGQKMGDENWLSLRGQLRFAPLDSMDVLLRADYSKSDLAGDPRIPVGGDLSVPFPPAAGPIANAAGGGTDHPRKSLADTPGFADLEAFGVSATLNWDLPFGTLTSITAYREIDFDHLADPLGLDDVLFPINGSDAEDETSKQFSQELRLANEFDHWRATGGFYYMREDAERVETIDPALTVPGPITFNSLNIFDQANVTNSFAVFADATYYITDQLNFTGGIRYTNESKDYDHTNAGVIAGPGSVQDELFTINVDETWDAVTFRAVLDYQWTDDLLFFASTSRGFKSGGFQGQPGTEASARTPFDPEFVFNYELGMKSMWLDDRLRFNINFFFMDYRDIQVTALVSTPSNPVGNLITTNAGKSEIKGFELEWTFRPLAELELYGMYAFLDTEVTSAPSSNQNVIGEIMQNAPRNKVSVGAVWTFPIGRWGDISARASYSFVDRFADGDPDDVDTRIPSHDVVDARLSYLNPDYNVELSMWVKNAFDETYRSQAFDVAGSGFALFAPPRTFGGTLTWRFE